MLRNVIIGIVIMNTKSLLLCAFNVLCLTLKNTFCLIDDLLSSFETKILTAPNARSTRNGVLRRQVERALHDLAHRSRLCHPRGRYQQPEEARREVWN